MINERLKLNGTVNLCVRGADGLVKEDRTIENLVVNAGLAYIISRMVGTAKPAISHMALGAGTTAAAGAQTDLIAMLGAREAPIAELAKRDLHRAERIALAREDGEFDERVDRLRLKSPRESPHARDSDRVQHAQVPPGDADHG